MTPLAAALECVAFGWPVFPVNPATNTPLTGHGFHDATFDADRIERWWHSRPDASIGVATGVACDVLDIDLEDFAEGVADLPDSVVHAPQARSGGGGWHLYFRPTGLGRRIRFSKHCDWLGTDGYVIVPPSGHKSGGHYSWIWRPDEVELHDVPPALVLAVERAKKDAPRNTPPVASPTDLFASPTRWNPAGIIGTLATATEGDRNQTLVWAAHKIGLDVHAGKAPRRDADDACAELERVALMIGLGERETIRTITSGYEAGLAGKGQR